MTISQQVWYLYMLNYFVSLTAAIAYTFSINSRRSSDFDYCGILPLSELIIGFVLKSQCELCFDKSNLSPVLVQSDISSVDLVDLSVVVFSLFLTARLEVPGS